MPELSLTRVSPCSSCFCFNVSDGHHDDDDDDDDDYYEDHDIDGQAPSLLVNMLSWLRREFSFVRISFLWQDFFIRLIIITRLIISMSQLIVFFSSFSFLSALSTLS